MLPRETLATAQIPDGGELTLVSHGRDFIIMLGRDELMGTRMQYSEEQLALLTLKELDKPAPRVLIGGYGMGFTFRAALTGVGEKGEVVVAEIVSEVLEGQKGRCLNSRGDCLKDPRGEVVLCDVAALIDDANDGTCGKFDAILLDVDNGPTASCVTPTTGFTREPVLRRLRTRSIRRAFWRSGQPRQITNSRAA